MSDTPMSLRLTPVSGAEPRIDPETGREVVDIATCGHCERSWNDAAISGSTPAPSGRCPFEYEHEYDEDEGDEPGREWFATLPDGTEVLIRLDGDELTVAARAGASGLFHEPVTAWECRDG